MAPTSSSCRERDPACFALVCEREVLEKCPADEGGVRRSTGREMHPRERPVHRPVKFRNIDLREVAIDLGSAMDSRDGGSIDHRQIEFERQRGVDATLLRPGVDKAGKAISGRDGSPPDTSV